MRGLLEIGCTRKDDRKWMESEWKTKKLSERKKERKNEPKKERTKENERKKERKEERKKERKKERNLGRIKSVSASQHLIILLRVTHYRAPV